jgi:hypothetical protein
MAPAPASERIDAPASTFLENRIIGEHKVVVLTEFVDLTHPRFAPAIDGPYAFLAVLNSVIQPLITWTRRSGRP